MTDEQEYKVIIRARRSYKCWWDWIDFLVNATERGILPADVKKILDRVWQDIDDKGGFHYVHFSEASRESLELAYSDYYTPHGAHVGDISSSLNH